MLEGFLEEREGSYAIFLYCISNGICSIREAIHIHLLHTQHPMETKCFTHP